MKLIVGQLYQLKHGVKRVLWRHGPERHEKGIQDDFSHPIIPRETFMLLKHVSAGYKEWLKVLCGERVGWIFCGEKTLPGAVVTLVPGHSPGLHEHDEG